MASDGLSLHVPGGLDSLRGWAGVQLVEGEEPGGSEHAHHDQQQAGGRHLSVKKIAEISGFHSLVDIRRKGPIQSRHFRGAVLFRHCSVSLRHM